MHEHEHFCPECKTTWKCDNEGRVWGQEDSDCRWFGRLLCKDCLKRTGRDVHADAALILFGVEAPTEEQRRRAKNATYLVLYSNKPPMEFSVIPIPPQEKDGLAEYVKKLNLKIASVFAIPRENNTKLLTGKCGDSTETEQ